MKTFLETLCFQFAQSNKIHFIWCLALLITLLILAILHHRWRYYSDMLKRWRELCFIPFLITTIHYFIYVAGASFFLNTYTPMYLIALITFIPMLCAEHKSYKVFAPITGVLAVVFSLYFCASALNCHNYSRKSYSKSFHALAEEMNKTYVLKEWKNIDFSELEEKYMPMVKEAEDEKDPAKFADAVTMFCNELHDSHISVNTNFDSEKYHSVFEMHDYGLAMIQINSGEVIAVCTDPKVRKLGIEDGTVITKWNGKPVLQAAEEDVPDMGIPVKANADRLAFIDLSATGDETVSVGFINKSGKEKNVELSALEDEHTLEDAYNAFSHSPEKISELLSSNFSTKMLNDKCGYLVLSAETSGSLRDYIAYYSGESKWAKKMFRNKLRSLKDKGMEYLIIDMRNNMGGFGEVGNALISLLTDSDCSGERLGTNKNGKYKCIAEHNIKGDGEFADLKVVVLTNYNCVSAGDYTADRLSKLPNVTLAGITDPCGSAQMTGGCCVLSKEIVIVNYPIGLVLNEDGEPDIDPKADRISRAPVEVRIPLDYDAAMKIFRDKEDYELNWAVEYLEKTENTKAKLAS